MTLHNLQHEAHKITLSPQEKALMRSQIFPTQAATPSYTVSHFNFFSIKFAPALAAVLIVVLGGGTAYAAQAALPGELLYTVKVNVNEPVREALAVSTEAKAVFHTSVAQTRLEEAEALAAEGKLTAGASAEIETRLEAHLARAAEVKVKLEEEDKRDLAGEVEAELDSALAAHGAILAKLGEESEDEETREHSSSLAGRITSRVFARFEAGAGTSLALKVAAPAEMALMVEEDASASASGTPMVSDDELQSEASKRAVEALKARAEKSLKEAKETFDDIKAGLEATTTARVEAQFKTLEGQVAEGERLYQAGDYTSARATFNAAIRDMIELNTYLRAEQRFNKKLLRGWLDTRFGEWFAPEVRGVHTGDDKDQHDYPSRGRDGDDGEDGRGWDDDKNDDSRSNIKVEVNLGL